MFSFSFEFPGCCRPNLLEVVALDRLVTLFGPGFSLAAARCAAAWRYIRHAEVLRSPEWAFWLWNGCREGWYSLASHTLSKLAACQLASKGASAGAGLADTAAAMLALPRQHRPDGFDDAAAAKLLLAAAGAAATTEGALYQVQPPLLGEQQQPVLHCGVSP